jgi:hypothetical protein
LTQNTLCQRCHFSNSNNDPFIIHFLVFWLLTLCFLLLLIVI